VVSKKRHKEVLSTGGSSTGLSQNVASQRLAQWSLLVQQQITKHDIVVVLPAHHILLLQGCSGCSNGFEDCVAGCAWWLSEMLQTAILISSDMCS
jgi:hypothetical protein